MDDILNNPVALAVIAGAVVLVLVLSFTGGSSTKSRSVAPNASAGTTGGGSKKKKKKAKKKAATEIKPEPEPVPELEPEPVIAAGGGGGKKKKKKKTKNGSTAVAAAPPPPAPEPEPQPEPEPEPPKPTSSKKKKKKKGAAAKPAPAPAPAAIVEDDDDDDDDDALLTFAKGSRPTAASSSSKKSNNKKVEDDGGGWNTIGSKGKSKAKAAAVAPVATDGTVTLNLKAEDIPILIGPKGATIQQLQAATGAKLDVSKGAINEFPHVKISADSEQAVALALEQVQRVLREAAAATAHTVTLQGSTINSQNGIKAIIGRGGATIQKIQQESGCQLNASIDKGTVVITGPSAEAVKHAETLCKNAVFGESNTNVDLKSRGMVMAVCGKNMARLREWQDETACRLEFTEPGSTVLRVSGDTAQVPIALNLIRQRMQLCQGVTMTIETAKIGAVFGKGGTNLRRIQESTGASVEIVQGPESVDCSIVGEPAAVQAAQAMIQKSLSGEVELKPGQVLAKVELGVGVSAVIGRGGSKIAELELKHSVQLNVVSGTSECTIVGSKDKVQAAKTEIEGIVTPIIEKAEAEARIEAEAEALAANGNGANGWGAAATPDDDLDGW